MRSKLNLDVFSERLKYIREKEKHWTQEKLAKRIGVSTKTINDWETKKTKGGIRAENIISLCQQLGCDFEYLYGGIDEFNHLYSDLRSETRLSKEAIDRLVQLDVLTYADEEKHKRIGYQFTDFYSEFISSNKIFFEIDHYISNMERVYNSGLSDNEEEALSWITSGKELQETKAFYEYVLQKAISEFIEEYSKKYFNIEKQGGLTDGIDHTEKK